MAVVGALGNLVRFLLRPGKTHDTKGVAQLITGFSFEALMVEKAIDADCLLRDIDARGAIAVISPKANRKNQREYDPEAYKLRYLVEDYIVKIKEFRGIATHDDKTDCSSANSWNLAAAIIESR